ncbi:LysR family transcriptional regulator [uncultured Paraglaciecola sp.]|uniref:LysR family transcriptional regulator n=1 Tax=uncultured Paraglaciecola sp. TaxID=1765024 RepID=UPI0026082CDC|nr:LysR family transcriptional regulator [uncultured Paraglaciecola sp.]
MTVKSPNKQKLASQLSNFDIRLLRIFRTVVECGGFSAAEVELNISRSAISISMSDLEERLGLRLCQRGRAGFSLTDEGELIYQASQQLMTSLENFRTQVNTIHAKLTGELNIGITDNLVTLEYMRVSKALKALKSEDSEVEINIRMIPPNEIERYVLDGGLHVGVVPDLRPLPGLEYSRLYTEKSLLYCNFEHPLFNADDKNLHADKIKTFEAVAPSYAQTAQTRVHYQALNTTATATDREGVAFLILTGCFVGYLPTHYAKRWVESGKMRALCPDNFNFSTEYQVVLRKGVKPNLVLKTFLQEINQQTEVR